MLSSCLFVLGLKYFLINPTGFIFLTYHSLICFSELSSICANAPNLRCTSFSLFLLTHLAIEQRVVVPPHFWVNIVEVPLKAFTLQTLPQCNPLRDVSVINTVVLQEHNESLWEVPMLYRGVLST